MPGCRRGIPTGRTAWRPGRESRIMTCAGQGTPLLPALQGTAGRRRRCRRKLMDQIYLPVAKTVIRQHRIPLPRFFPDRNQLDQNHMCQKPGGAAKDRAMLLTGIPGRRISARGAQGGAMPLTRISSRKNPDKQISARRAQGDAMPLTRISGRKNPDKQISARRAQGGAMPLTRISGRKNPHRRIPDRQFLKNTVRKVRIPGMGNYFRKEPGHRKGKKNPARQDTGTGHGSMVINTNSAFRRRQKPGNLRRNRRRQPKENQNGLPSWNLPLTNSHRKQRIRSSRKPDGRQNGQRKNWNRRKTAFLPAVSCGWKHLLIPIRARPKSA